MSDFTLEQEQEQDAMLLDAQIDDLHPESFCQRCGAANFSWFVPSDRFNIAMDALNLTSGVIVCTSCFIEGHEKATGMTASWELVPATPFRWREDS